MSAIKDVYDLSKELKNSISDRKQLSIMMTILDKIQDAERENFELEKSQFALERKHQEEMTKLQSEHSATVSALESRISELESELELKSRPARQFRIDRG